MRIRPGPCHNCCRWWCRGGLLLLLVVLVVVGLGLHTHSCCGEAEVEEGSGPKRLCLLTPTHDTHFRYVRLMLDAVEALAQDWGDGGVMIFVVVDDMAAARRFCSGGGGGGVGGSIPSQDSALAASPCARRPALHMLRMDALMLAAAEGWKKGRAERETQPSFGLGDARALERHWPRLKRHNRLGWMSWGRVYQGLKKWLGVLAAGEVYGCDLVWVVDAESFPFREFSFAQIGRRFWQAPWFSAVNLTGSGVAHRWASAATRHVLDTFRLHEPPWTPTHTTACATSGSSVPGDGDCVSGQAPTGSACAASSPIVKAEGLAQVAADLERSMHFRVQDFWMYEPGILRQLVNHVECARDQSLSRVWMTAPLMASESVAYSVWLALHSHAAGAPGLYRNYTLRNFNVHLARAAPNVHRQLCTPGASGAVDSATWLNPLLCAMPHAFLSPEVLREVRARGRNAAEGNGLVSQLMSALNSFDPVLRGGDPVRGLHGQVDPSRLLRNATVEAVPNLRWCCSNCYEAAPNAAPPHLSP